MENSFLTVLEQVILAQNPDLYVYAQKLHKGLIPDKETVFCSVYAGSVLFPKAPEGFKFKNPSSSATVRATVVKHDKINNQVLLEDGRWVDAVNSRDSESTWIHELEPIEPIVLGEAKPKHHEDVFG